MSRIPAIELNGKPRWVEASFVSGLNNLPIRFELT